MSNQYFITQKKACSFCNDPGHHISNCTVLADAICKNCHEKGHTTKHCKIPRITSKNTSENGWSTVGRKPVRRLTYSNRDAPLVAPVVAPVAPVVAPVAPMDASSWPSLPKAVKPSLHVIVLKKESFVKKIVQDIPILTKRIPKGVRWADICDEESDDESDDE